MKFDDKSQISGHRRTDGGHGVAVHAGRETFERTYGSELDLLAQTISEAI